MSSTHNEPAARPTPSYGVPDDQLERAAQYLAQHHRENKPCTLQPALCGKLADALVEVMNRRGDG